MTRCSFGSKFWFEIALSVKLRRVYEALTHLIICLQHNAVSWDLLIILQNDNITNLEVCGNNFFFFYITGRLIYVDPLNLLIVNLFITTPSAQVGY